MKRTTVICIVLAIAATSAVFAQTKTPTDPILDQMIPFCADNKITKSDFKGNLPYGWTATAYQSENSDPYCQWSGVRVTAPDGRVFVGSPWPIGDSKEPGPDKLKKFAWDRLQLNWTVENLGIDGPLQKVRIQQITGAGRVQLEGYLDAGGSWFFLGDFTKNDKELLAKRDQRLEAVLAKAPAKGPATAPVTILEFSDFQCPSCKRAHDFMKPLLEKHGDKIHYVRVDLPLLTAHPWAFSAAIMGRAIARQNLDEFWKYKDAVYSNQDKLSAFTIDEFGRNFASDHGLDLKKFDADVASDSLHKEILDGVGTSFTMQIQGTPSYLINDRIVSSGLEGKKLSEYIEGLLAGK